MSNIRFQEVQRFRQPALVVFLILLNVGGMVVVFGRIFFGWPMFETRWSDLQLLLFWLPLPLLTLFLMSIRLETQITDTEVKGRLWPFHLSWKVFPYKDLQSAEIRQYSPILEYGGWGWRLSIIGRGIAWNIAGNQGLQLVFHNGRKLLIGTQKPEALQAALKGAGK
jgi:hypothetical protein